MVGKSRSSGESVSGDEEFEKDKTGVVSTVVAVGVDGFSRVVVDSTEAAPIVAEDFSQNGSSNPSRSKVRSKGKFERRLSSNADAVEVGINPSWAVSFEAVGVEGSKEAPIHPSLVKYG